MKLRKLVLRMKSWLIRLALLFAVALVAGSSLMLADSSLSPAQYEIAVAGVSKNEAWQPVIRRFGGVKMALVPAGCFTMGTTGDQMQAATQSCDAFYGAFGCPHSFANEQPAHTVCLSEPFWLDVTPVTNIQYMLISRSLWDSPFPDLRLPLQAIPWQEAAEYCASRGARLPTEAEWEYAARGPDALIYPFGNTYDLRLATLRKISPPEMGQIPAGASWTGALDMSGGMAEWVSDWYGPYSQEEQVDPLGPPDGTTRILRGGDWFAHAGFLVRTTYRDPIDPGFATSKNGFRCARDFSP